MTTRRSPRKAQNWQALGSAIEQDRLNQRLTQQDIVERSGVSRTTLQSIEKGTPHVGIPETVLRVVDVLGWPLGYENLILDGKESEPPEQRNGQTAYLSQVDGSPTLRASSPYLEGPDVRYSEMPDAELALIIREASAEQMRRIRVGIVPSSRTFRRSRR